MHKTSEIEYVFVAKLNRVMKRAHRLWPNDERIWATHVALLEKWNKRTQLSKLYEVKGFENIERKYTLDKFKVAK